MNFASQLELRSYNVKQSDSEKRETATAKGKIQ